MGDREREQIDEENEEESDERKEEGAYLRRDWPVGVRMLSP